MMKLHLPCYVFISLGDDNYRKPNTGIWDKITTLIPDIKYAFYVGDALGRPKIFLIQIKSLPRILEFHISPQRIFFLRRYLNFPRGINI